MFDFPSSPTTGQQVTASNGAVWAWDGTKWQAAPGALTQSYAVVGDAPPANPTNGMLWFDSVGAQLYVSYADANSQQWVLATSPPTPPAQATAGNVGRNLLHNSMFNVQQRGVGPWTTLNSYTADRWVFGFNLDTDSVTVGTLTDADRVQIGDELARYCLTNVFTGNAGADAYSLISQLIEGVRRSSGKTVTISFWAKAASGTTKLGVGMAQTFGSGGSPSPWTGLPGQAVTLSTTWGRYNVVFNVPSTAGKTLGTSGNDSFEVDFYFSSGTSNAVWSGIGVQSGTVQLWGVQLEVGSGYGFPTPLEKIDPQADLANCQRFYQGGQVQLNCYGVAGNAIVVSSPFPVAMRATPSITPGTITYVNSSGANPAPTAANLLTLNFTPTVTGPTACVYPYTASADL